MAHVTQGHHLNHLSRYEHLLCHHHVLGASLLLKSGEEQCAVFTSLLDEPQRHCGPETLFRVASLTKMATAMVLLRLCEQGAFTLDTPVAALLPDGEKEDKLSGMTLRHLLCHTSGLRDLPAVDAALENGDTWHSVLQDGKIRASYPGEQFSYCNFGFGLLGCVMEQVTGQPLPQVFEEQLFIPLGMKAVLDASGLDRDTVMPISRVLRYHPGETVVVTKLGSIPLNKPDPLRHFGHTAGAMYTDASSLSLLLEVIFQGGLGREKRFLSEESIREMTKAHASYGKLSPTLSYGLGLVIIQDKALSSHRLLGHQGFAYGCADGAFFEEETGRQIIFLNGGCSEARTGRLGLCNRDMLRFGLKKELPSWR